MADDEATPRKMIFFVVTSSRSGAEFLCSLLRSVRIGNPSGYFNTPKFQLNDPAGIKAFAANTFDTYGRRDILGIKALPGLVQKVMPVLRDEYDLAYVFNTRRDLVRQAISLYRAGYDGQWTLKRGDEAKRKRQPPPFDADAIKSKLTSIIRVNQAIEVFLADKPHVRTVYENVVASPRKAILKVARHLGIEMADAEPASDMAQQGTAINDKWAAKLDGPGMIEEITQALAKK